MRAAVPVQHHDAAEDPLEQAQLPLLADACPAPRGEPSPTRINMEMADCLRALWPSGSVRKQRSLDDSTLVDAARALGISECAPPRLALAPLPDPLSTRSCKVTGYPITGYVKRYKFGSRDLSAATGVSAARPTQATLGD